MWLKNRIACAFKFGALFRFERGGERFVVEKNQDVDKIILVFSLVFLCGPRYKQPNGTRVTSLSIYAPD